MKARHPLAGKAKGTTVPADLQAYADKLADLPSKEMAARKKVYWNGQGILPAGELVPAGVYTDPEPESDKDRKRVDDAVVGAYAAMKGTPVTRHRIAVALNFQVADDVDIVRARLLAAEKRTITAGARGKSSAAYGMTPPEPVKAAKVAAVPAPEPAKAAAKVSSAKPPAKPRKAPAKAPAA